MITQKDRECRFISEEYCSVMIVNSIGNVFNVHSWPQERLVILKSQIEALNSIPGGFPFEIIVIDDNSDEDTVNFLISCYKSGLINMLFLQNTRKLGNGFCKNIPLSFLSNHILSKSYLPRDNTPYGQIGERSFQPKYCMLAENDILPLEENWLLKCVEIIENNPDIGFLNSIDNFDFDEDDFHKLLRTKSWGKYILEYRKLIPGSMYFTKTEYLLKVGNHTVWDLSVSHGRKGYDYLNIPGEYEPQKFYCGSWDEELSLRFAHHGLYGVNVLPFLFDHRKIAHKS